MNVAETRPTLQEAIDTPPSKAACVKALQGMFNDSARFQTLRGPNRLKAIGLAALVTLNGQTYEIASVEPKPDAKIPANDPRLPFMLLQACGEAIEVGVSWNKAIGAIEVRRLGKAAKFWRRIVKTFRRR